MTSKTLLLILGIVFFVLAVLVAVLNLRRVANLGMPGLAPIFVVLGIVFVAAARKR